MEWLIDVLHAFGAGLAFALGVFCGGVMMQFATRQGYKEAADAIHKSNTELSEKCEERIREQVTAMFRIADTLDDFKKRYDALEG